VKAAESPDGEKLIADLLSRGVLTTSPTPSRHVDCGGTLSALTISPSAGAGRFTPALIARFTLASLTVALRHRDSRLASLLGWLRQRQSAIHHEGHSLTPDQVSRLMAYFSDCAFGSTRQTNVYVRLAGLAVFLTGRMIPCTFVIGVSVKPFLAHSWVQIGELVLNDTADTSKHHADSRHCES